MLSGGKLVSLNENQGGKGEGMERSVVAIRDIMCDGWKIQWETER